MNIRQQLGTSLIRLIQRLFGIKTNTLTLKRYTDLWDYVEAYKNIDGSNITRIAANKIANIVSFDSKISIAGDNDRAQYLNIISKPYFEQNLKKLTARIVGTGGVILKPCTVNNDICIEVLYQPQLITYDLAGGRLRKAAFMAQEIQSENDTYSRVEIHTLSDNGVYTIEQKAYKGDKEIALETIPEWAGFEPLQTLNNVKSMLFSVITNSTDSGEEFDCVFGVPITFGHDRLMIDIVKMMERISKEFKLKAPRLGVDPRLYKRGKNGEPIIADEQIAEIYFNFANEEVENAFKIYAPNYQEENIINAVEYLYSQLENGIGVNRGVFTKLETTGATATEIKQSMFETLCLVGSLRKKLEQGFEQLIYACDAIATLNNIVPAGEYEIVPEWDYSLFESSSEKWQRIMDGLSSGAWGAERLRMEELGEDEETALKNIPEQIETNTIGE